MSKLWLAVLLFATTFCLFQDSVEATCCAHCISGCKRHPGGCDSLCSTDYRLVNYYCVPRCGGNCRQGYCYGVGDCRLCRVGYHVNLGGTCDIGTCDPHCTNTAKCAKAGTCYTQLCVTGYQYDPTFFYCVPVVVQTTVTAGTSTTAVLQTTSVAASTPPATAGTTPAVTTPVPTTASLCQATYCIGTCTSQGAGTCDANSCQPNYISVAASGYHCVECDPNCVPTTPGSCKNDIAGTCGTSCIGGYRLSTTVYQCQACATGCTTCPSAGTCGTNSCNPGYVWDSTTGNCYPCASHCSGCTTSGTCDGAGVCATGYAKISGTSQCGACSANCNACSVAGQCNAGACAAGYALDPSTQTCLACQGGPYCNTASGCTIPGTCTTCNSGYYPNSNNVCA